jgi:hypothetical protein
LNKGKESREGSVGICVCGDEVIVEVSAIRRTELAAPLINDSIQVGTVPSKYGEVVGPGHSFFKVGVGKDANRVPGQPICLGIRVKGKVDLADESADYQHVVVVTGIIRSPAIQENGCLIRVERNGLVLLDSDLPMAWVNLGAAGPVDDNHGTYLFGDDLTGLGR